MTSDGSAGSLAWRLSSGLDDPYTPCWPKWRMPCQWRRCPKWCIKSTAVAASVMLGRQWGDLKPEWRALGCLSEGDTGEVSACHHPIKWEETIVVDQARTPKELLLKEAIHIRLLKPPLGGSHTTVKMMAMVTSRFVSHTSHFVPWPSLWA